jgi:hypothetical protein
MLNIFASLRKYASKWSEKEVRPFNADEITAVTRNEIIASQYGNSVCFYMADGSQCYIPCDRDCTKGIGESIDMSKAMLKTLTKPGEEDILRVME